MAATPNILSALLAMALLGGCVGPEVSLQTEATALPDGYALSAAAKNTGTKALPFEESECDEPGPSLNHPWRSQVFDASGELVAEPGISRGDACGSSMTELGEGRTLWFNATFEPARHGRTIHEEFIWEIALYSYPGGEEQVTTRTVQLSR
jgi:hypothetical protein